MEKLEVTKQCDRQRYMLSYNTDTGMVELYGTPVGAINSDTVHGLWLTVLSMDNRVDENGYPLVHGSLWTKAIRKVKDTKRCPVCGHVHDYHETGIVESISIGFCLHCKTNLYRDSKGNYYTMVGNKSGYWLLVDTIKGDASLWKPCHRHYAR